VIPNKLLAQQKYSPNLTNVAVYLILAQVTREKAKADGGAEETFKEAEQRMK